MIYIMAATYQHASFWALSRGLWNLRRQPWRFLDDHPVLYGALEPMVYIYETAVRHPFYAELWETCVARGALRVNDNGELRPFGR